MVYVRFPLVLFFFCNLIWLKRQKGKQITSRQHEKEQMFARLSCVCVGFFLSCVRERVGNRHQPRMNDDYWEN